MVTDLSQEDIWLFREWYSNFFLPPVLRQNYEVVVLAYFIMVSEQLCPGLVF